MWYDPYKLKKLTADEVKKLPVGTEILLHGRDRHGEATQLECTVTQSGKKKILSYWDINGCRETKPIRQLDGVDRFYSVKPDI